jgi:hypothetical protein
MTIKSPEEYRNEKVLIDFKSGSMAQFMSVGFNDFSMDFEKGCGPFEVPRLALKRLKKLGFAEAEKKPHLNPNN